MCINVLKMDPMHCFKVLIILLQVYHSSTSDISDWLIRQGSSFDKPVTFRINSRHFPEPDPKRNKNRFQQAASPLFTPNFFLKSPVLNRRRSDSFKDQDFIKYLGLRQYVDQTHHPYSSGSGQRRKEKNILKQSLKIKPYIVNQSPVGWGLFYKTQDVRKNEENRRSGENLSPLDWNILTESLRNNYGENLARSGVENRNRIIVQSRPVLLQTTYILPARRHYIQPVNFYPSKSKNLGKERSLNYFQEFMKNYNSDKLYKLSKYKNPKQQAKFYIRPAEESTNFPLQNFSKSQTYIDSLNSLNFRKMFSNNPSENRRYRRSALNLEKKFTFGENKPKPQDEESKEKYPYYNFYNTGDLLKDSPLKYAESVKNIPRKSEGGTEFYDSKRRFCSEVESDVDAVPDRIKNMMPEDEDDDSSDNEEEEGEEGEAHRAKRNVEEKKGKPRLTGLGDKIDCFKDKYFGINPLDNPFFYEDTIEPPEPIQTPFLLSSPLRKISLHNYEDTSLFIPLMTVTATTKPHVSKAERRLWKDPNKETKKIFNHLTQTKQNTNYQSAKPQVVNDYQPIKPNLLNNKSVKPKINDKTIQDHQGAQPKIHDYKTIKPTTYEYESVIPKNHKYQATKPKMYDYELVKPKIHDYKSIKPKIYGKESVKPKIHNYQSIKPKIYEHESVEPKIPNFQSLKPKINDYRSTRPKSVHAYLVAKPKLNDYESIKPKLQSYQSTTPRITHSYQVTEPKIDDIPSFKTKTSGYLSQPKIIHKYQSIQPTIKNANQLTEPNYQENIAKLYSASIGVNNNKFATNRNTISLPAAIFDKYTQSTDPQTRVYDDVIGNIRSNLNQYGNENQSSGAYASNSNVTDLNKQTQSKDDNAVYQAYTRKESIRNPYKQIRHKREAELFVDLPTLIPDTIEEIHNTTEVAILDSVTEVQIPVVTDRKTDDKDEMSKKKKFLTKSYSDVNKKHRQNYQNLRVGDILEAATFEREKTINLRNRRRGHPPPTTKKSISAEFLVPSITEQTKVSNSFKTVETTTLSPDPVKLDTTITVYNNETQTVIDPVDGSLVNASNLTDLTQSEYNSSKFHSPGLQNENSRRSDSIFDVSAYLPEPLLFETQTPRHNISSKYNLNTLLAAKEGGQLYAVLKEKNSKIIAPYSEQPIIDPTEIVPEINNGSITTQNNLKESINEKIFTEIIPPERKTRLHSDGKHIITSTARSTTTLRHALPIEDTYTFTESPRRIKTTTRHRNSQRVRIRKPKITTTSTTTLSTPLAHYRVTLFDEKEDEEFEINKNIFSNLETIPKSSVIIPTTERHTTITSRRGRRPQKSYHRQYNHDNADNGYEHTARKPKILEKTSTKRKTTVITNSKRYENNDNVEPNYDTPIEKQSTIIFNQENSDNSPEEPRESESVNYNRDASNSPTEGVVFTKRDKIVKKPYRGRKKGETRRRPVKEESRYQEDVEEEEIIQERSTPYHDPELPKQINNLSEVEEEAQYGNFGEGFTSESTNNQEPETEQSDKTSEDLVDSYVKEEHQRSLSFDDPHTKTTKFGGRALDDGGMSARILDSFASFITMDSMTAKPIFEKNPSQRFYFYVDES